MISGNLQKLFFVVAVLLMSAFSAVAAAWFLSSSIGNI